MFTNRHRSTVIVILAFAAGSAFAAQPSTSADFPVGTYTSSGLVLTFDGKGQFRVSQDAAMKVEGDYQTNADQLHLTDKGGPWACTGAESKSGSYHWSVNQGTLTFSKVDDACKERVDSLIARSWKKQG